MIEYSRKLLNSNCDLNFIKNIVHIIMQNKFIETSVLNTIESNNNLKNNNKQSQITYDITNNHTIRQYCINYCINETIFGYYDYDLSWNFALEIIVKNLKNIFVDSTIYFKNEELNDTNESVRRLIIVDWSINN